MAEFMQWMAAFVVLMVALGLVRVARGPGRAERMMAAQLLGTGGIARCCCSERPAASRRSSTWR
jgi:multicomponent Na+:H+ antiporter subunit F